MWKKIQNMNSKRKSVYKSQMKAYKTHYAYMKTWCCYMNDTYITWCLFVFWFLFSIMLLFSIVHSNSLVPCVTIKSKKNITIPFNMKLKPNKPTMACIYKISVKKSMMYHFFQKKNYKNVYLTVVVVRFENVTSIFFRFMLQS